MPKPYVHLLGPPSGLAPECQVGRESGQICEANGDIVLSWEWDDANAVHNISTLLQAAYMSPPPSIPSSFGPIQVQHFKNQYSNIRDDLRKPLPLAHVALEEGTAPLTQMGLLYPDDTGERIMVDVGALVKRKSGLDEGSLPGSGGMGWVGMVPDERSTPSPGPLGRKNEGLYLRREKELPPHPPSFDCVPPLPALSKSRWGARQTLNTPETPGQGSGHLLHRFWTSSYCLRAASVSLSQSPTPVAEPPVQHSPSLALLLQHQQMVPRLMPSASSSTSFSLRLISIGESDGLASAEKAKTEETKVCQEPRPPHHNAMDTDKSDKTDASHRPGSRLRDGRNGKLLPLRPEHFQCELHYRKGNILPTICLHDLLRRERLSLETRKSIYARQNQGALYRQVPTGPQLSGKLLMQHLSSSTTASELVIGERENVETWFKFRTK
ncbi:hypothetical protein CPB83DRAFT_840450 [Crepidotus variabilis]|uniref:Uncharacterized protein n=1 Tax=Crepidotus variabilis TaxID=179855 RepID=A0A9P6E4W5_9AGAR|nr:hypothetical protein CPB83DRAFT_840450 [Crepidotus variabilis]